LKQFLKVIKNNLADSVFSMSQLITVTLDAFVLNILLVRFLSLSELGDYKLFFSVINIIIIFSINGLNVSISKSIAKGYKVFLKKATQISVFFSIIGSVVLVILSFTYYRDSNIRWALLYSSLMIPFYFGLNTWEFFLLGEKNFKQIFLNYLFMVLTRLAFCGLALFYFKNSTITILIFLSVTMFFNIIYYFKILKQTDWDKKNLEKQKALIKHGLKLTGANVVSIITKNSERIILYAVSTSVVVGIYSIAVIIPTFIKNALKTLVTVPTVKLSYRTEAENRIVIKRYLLLIFVCGIATFGIFWFISPYLLQIFFDVTDPEIIWYSKLILIPLIFFPFNLVITRMITFQGSGNNFIILNSITELIGLILLGALIPFYQIYGIIIALSAGELISFFILLFWFIFSNKKFGVR